MIESYWHCENGCLDYIEVRSLARHASLLAGEVCLFCGETLTEQDLQAMQGA